MSDTLPSTYILLPASKRPRTRAQLTAALEPALKDVLARVCLWGDDWSVGDYRFCILSYDLPNDVQLFLQFWSEPDDVVFWEVSSGKGHAATEAYLAGEPGQRVLAAGFEMGGEAENYQQVLDVDTPRDVAALTKQVIGVLYDALGYRGQQALDVQAVEDSRALRAVVYDAITPDDLASLLEYAGYTCEVGEQADDEEAETVPVFVRRYGIKAMAMLGARHPEDGAFQAVALGPAPPASQPASDALLTEGIDVLILPLAGGVTAQWLELQVASWFEVRRQEKRRKGRRQVPPARARGSRSVH